MVGLSDHTLGSESAVASVSLGASIFEKHFTLDKHQGGPDDAFSIEPDEFHRLCSSVRTAWSALGVPNYDLKPSERRNLKLQRSLYFVKDMNIGDVITHKCVRSIRPGYGLSPKFLSYIIGRKVSCKIKRGTPVSNDKILADK